MREPAQGPLVVILVSLGDLLELADLEARQLANVWVAEELERVVLRAEELVP